MSGPRARKGRVLVVEDEAYVRESLADMLRSRGYVVDVAGTVDEGAVSLNRSPVDAVITDLRLPGPDGLEMVRRVQASSPEVPIIVLTGHGTVPSAVECLKSGASDYILKPAAPDALEVALDRAMTARAIKSELAYLRGSRAGPDSAVDAVGRSPAWLRVMDKVRAAAPTDSTVLLLGESGTGKELLARLVHRWGPRPKGPYVRVNCAATPLEIWESEFFGHRKGAYTGAAADREGRFRMAHRGTLFLDEVGAMPLPAQAKLLRVIQDGEFERLGDEQPTVVDVRIVAATNSDLEADVAAGRFRQDLFYRLNVLRIDIPPLRDRPEDIVLLAERFVAEIAERLGRPTPGIGRDTLAELIAYSWPGNVRELRNVIERAMILSPTDPLSLDASPVHALKPPSPDSLEGEAELNLRKVLGRREKELLQEALRRSRGVRKEAARLLGIDQRNLGYYLRKHQLDGPVTSEA
jgi:DNA-binding NtrC family response regulator